MSMPFFVPEPTSRADDDREAPSKSRFGPYEAPAAAMLGKPGQPVRALAFSGGLFDTAMQLGVAHALLVSRAEPPDIAVGVSTGAVNAVAQLPELGHTGLQFHLRISRSRANETQLSQTRISAITVFCEMPLGYRSDRESLIARR